MKEIKLKPSYEEIEVEMETILLRYSICSTIGAALIEETDDPTTITWGTLLFARARYFDSAWLD